MLMDEGLDTVPILLAKKIPIEPGETGESLEKKLAPLGAELLLQTLAAWEQNRLRPRPQDDSRATSAPRLRKEDARVDWSRRAEEIECRIRAFIPWPVAFTAIKGTTVKIFEAAIAPSENASPGETRSVDRQGILVACGSGTSLRLLVCQAEGGRRMAAAEFARGRRLTPGDLWGE